MTEVIASNININKNKISDKKKSNKPKSAQQDDEECYDDCGFFSCAYIEQQIKSEEKESTCRSRIPITSRIRTARSADVIARERSDTSLDSFDDNRSLLDSDSMSQ